MKIEAKIVVAVDSVGAVEKQEERGSIRAEVRRRRRQRRRSHDRSSERRLRRRRRALFCQLSQTGSKVSGKPRRSGEQNGELPGCLLRVELREKAPEESEMKRRRRTFSSEVMALIGDHANDRKRRFTDCQATQVRASRGWWWLLLFAMAALSTTCYGFDSSSSSSRSEVKAGELSPLRRQASAVEQRLQTRRRYVVNEQKVKVDRSFGLTGDHRRKRRFATSAGVADDDERAAGIASSANLPGALASESTSNLSSRPTSAIRNVSATNGQSVLLHCLVEPSADVAVSWFRGAGEPQLLTYMSDTIIPDERFVVRHNLMKDNDWALQIKNLDKSSDSGLYQCQTNSDPPQSQYYQLNVVEPQVNILGAPDLAVKLGAAINLTCVISQSPDQLQFVFWYRDQRMINFDISERGKIVMWKWPQRADTMISNLQIFSSRLSDSGNYTCMPSGARPMSIHVHVLEGLNKRLIMFQNDYDPSAASSQQTNSAFSVHVVRLSRGRAYALFVAFLIFASWFQLLLQAQTAISLLLLAIIGYLLGKINDSTAPDRTPTISTAQPQTANSQPNVYLDLADKKSYLTSEQASSLLKSIHDTDDDDEDEHRKSPQHPVRAAQRRSVTGKPPPLTSPSGQSTGSSSTGSTGYNSDTRSTNLTTQQVVVAAAAGVVSSASQVQTPANTAEDSDERTVNDNHEDDDDEMIELISQPTALRLIMDEFSSPRATPLEPYYSSPAPAVSGCGSIPASEANPSEVTPTSSAPPATSPRIA